MVFVISYFQENMENKSLKKKKKNIQNELISPDNIYISLLGF